MRRALIAALVAGFVACLAATAAQQAVVVPLILKAETFEDAGGAPAPHHHGIVGQPAAHHHDAEAWKPADGVERIAFTALANLGFGVGFGLLLVAAIALSGRSVDARTGLLWGAAGFVVFALAPSLGLPPELPGSVAAAVAPRQAWWFGTAVATAAGLALIVFGRSSVWKALGVLALVLPHAIGAPHPDGPEAGAAPPELAARFAVLSLATTAVFWAVLGAVSGAVYRRVG